MQEMHIPVLCDEVLDFLKPEPEGIYIDATIGLGGHSLRILKKSSPTGRVIGIDRDAEALGIASTRLHAFKDRVSLIHGNFAHLQQLLQTHTVSEVDGVLLDLGVSSLQLDTPSRGFSFQHLGALDMRMDLRDRVSAADLVNESTPEELVNIFKEYGEERFARRIARDIVARRTEKPITTTIELAEIVKRAYRHKVGGGKVSSSSHRKGVRLHPATRVFQALRIQVNGELENLSIGLDTVVSVLKPGASLCVISFHSLEDRLVKRRFRDLAKSCICPPKTPICICEHRQLLRVVTKTPVQPSANEVAANPRARSAKLRVAVKLSEPGRDSQKSVS